MRRRYASCVLALALSPPAARAVDVGPFEITLHGDVRAVAVDSPYASFVNGGFGLLRYDEDHDGLRLGRAFVDFAGPLAETIRAKVTFSATGDRGARAVDITEGFLEWRPYPTSNLKWRTKIGGFYPPVSLENRAIGWESPYTISTSAINTWLGEEVRAYGVEQTLTVVGGEKRPFDFSVIAAAYIWDDPMGIMVFQRGWALHDRQTGVFSSLPRPLRSNAFDQTIEFNREIDDRIGYYAGAEFKYGSHVIRALHYDNRGDPGISNGKEPAWLSRFESAGWRYELPTNATLIVQGLKGDTAVGRSADGRGFLIGDYWSYFVLASQQYRDHRFSARYDRFAVHSTRNANIFDSEQTGIAWTLAYLWDFAHSWQFAAEALEIRGSLLQRATKAGQTPDAPERILQLSFRYSL